MRKSTKTREKRRWKTKRVVSLSRSTMEGWECKKKLWRAFYGSDLFTERTLGFLKWSLCSRSAQSAQAPQGRVTDNCDPQTTCHTDFHQLLQTFGLRPWTMYARITIELSYERVLLFQSFREFIKKHCQIYCQPGDLGPRERIGHIVRVSIYANHNITTCCNLTFIPPLRYCLVIVTWNTFCFYNYS